ncbi:hypothetical protein SAMN05216316_2530 [Nitrosovibrio sp. Nv6]|nr:hypothetical protein SAMN05216316_2530 [Nitrosovibrio sp. Nv6]
MEEKCVAFLQHLLETSDTNFGPAKLTSIYLAARAAFYINTSAEWTSSFNRQTSPTP